MALLGLVEVTAGGVGIIIGAGIYVFLGAATAHAGPVVWVAFLLAAVLSALTGLSYAELSSMFPSAAGEYEYTRQALPEWIAFVVGWTMIAGLVVAARPSRSASHATSVTSSALTLVPPRWVFSPPCPGRGDGWRQTVCATHRRPERGPGRRARARRSDRAAARRRRRPPRRAQRSPASSGPLRSCSSRSSGSTKSLRSPKRHATRRDRPARPAAGTRAVDRCCTLLLPSPPSACWAPARSPRRRVRSPTSWRMCSALAARLSSLRSRS